VDAKLCGCVYISKLVAYHSGWNVLVSASEFSRHQRQLYQGRLFCSVYFGLLNVSSA